MDSQRRPDSLDVIGSGNAGSGVLRRAGAERGERDGGPAGSAERQSSGADVAVGAGLLA
jgi:hypothetical protein